MVETKEQIKEDDAAFVVMEASDGSDEEVDMPDPTLLTMQK